MFKKDIKDARVNYLKNAKDCENQTISKYKNDLMAVKHTLENYEFPKNVQNDLKEQWRKFYGDDRNLPNVMTLKIGC